MPGYVPPTYLTITMEQQQANAAGQRRQRPTPLDGRASYHHWTGIFNGEPFTYHHLAALFPERYAPYSGERFPWHCPVIDCHTVHQFVVELAGHFTVAHLGARLLDNRNGTFTFLGRQSDPRGFAYVAAQRYTLAAPVQSASSSEAEDDDGNESDQWRDSGVSMASTSRSGNGDEGGDEDEDEDDDVEMGDADDDSDSDSDYPDQTMLIQIPSPVGQTPGDGGSSAADGDPMDVDSNQAPAVQAAITPVPFFFRGPAPTVYDLQPRQELPDPTPLQLEIWPYITRWTLSPLPLPSPASPAHRTLLALLSFPRIRDLPVSWQERLRARTPSLGTLTAVALYLSGRAESGSPCQSHCGQYGALVERLFAVQRENAWENGLGAWKFERKFAFPRCVKVPEAVEGDAEVEEVLGGRPCCNHFFRELRGAWETSEPFPPKPPGGLVWNGPMW